jgi:hypothetical protein
MAWEADFRFAICDFGLVIRRGLFFCVESHMIMVLSDSLFNGDSLSMLNLHEDSLLDTDSLYACHQWPKPVQARRFPICRCDSRRRNVRDRRANRNLRTRAGGFSTERSGEAISVHPSAKHQHVGFEPKANITRRYDDQSVINFGDFNFDGWQDVAICDGTNGGYGMPSYRVYIYSNSTRRFVYSRPFTRMNDGGLGMFETNRKKKMHFVYTKSGCCWHQTQGFDVYRGRPRQVYEFTEDAAYHGNPSVVEIHNHQTN